jgi:SPP1 gp7 family putative phage head morphogenesis protein
MPSPEKEAEEILDPILVTFRTRLQAALLNHAVTAYLRGSAQMVEYGRTLTTDRPIYFEGPPMQQAINYANKHTAQLVTKMDVETKDRLAHVIGKAIKDKRGVDGLARDIRREFQDMTKYRSQLISRTETADALSQGSYERMKGIGATGKQWITVGDDKVAPECLGNEAEGIVPLDHVFSGGVSRPPQHPNCRCTIAPAMLPSK